MQRIYLSDAEGSQAICFDTGIDPLTFARTRMFESITESGYIVYPDGSREIWITSGIVEVNGYMRVFGPPFPGERLDLLLNEAASQEQSELREKALQAVVFLLRAKMLLGETNSTLNPGAVFVCLEDNKESKFPKGSVFLAPDALSKRCLTMEGAGTDHYNCSDLSGMDASAFFAGTMLYNILSKSFPYPNDKTIYQDMIEGIYLPPHLAIPELNKELCDLLQSALVLPVRKTQATKKGIDIISDLLKLLMDNENNIVPVSSLFIKLTGEELILLEKEKKKFLDKQNKSTKLKRFTIANKNALLGIAAGIIIVIIIIISTVNTMNERPTTRGMEAETVVMTYYDAFSSLDHVLMEACINGASKTDVNAAASLFAMYRTRQAYETSGVDSILVTAKEWKEAGGDLPAQDVFGVTDMSIRYINGSYDEGKVTYRVEYILWSPDADESFYRIDTLTLKLDRKKNWRITEIQRVET